MSWGGMALSTLGNSGVQGYLGKAPSSINTPGDLLLYVFRQNRDEEIYPIR